MQIGGFLAFDIKVTYVRNVAGGNPLRKQPNLPDFAATICN